MEIGRNYMTKNSLAWIISFGPLEVSNILFESFEEAASVASDLRSKNATVNVRLLREVI